MAWVLGLITPSLIGVGAPLTYIVDLVLGIGILFRSEEILTVLTTEKLGTEQELRTFPVLILSAISERLIKFSILMIHKMFYIIAQ